MLFIEICSYLFISDTEVLLYILSITNILYWPLILIHLLITDLSECQLMQVPDAVYHLMRHTELKSCDLSGNVITKIPPKFTVKFSLITGEIYYKYLIS